MKSFNQHSIAALAARNTKKVVNSPFKYTYRGLPCTNATHAVEGNDTKHGGGGVLEWCFSKEDAERIMEKMKRDTGRFTGLVVTTEDTMMDVWEEDEKERERDYQDGYDDGSYDTEGLHFALLR